MVSLVFPLLLPLLLVAWLLSQPQRYGFQLGATLPLLPPSLQGPLLLVLPLVLFLVLSLASSPLFRWALAPVLLAPYAILARALARAEGWWIPGFRSDTILATPWGSLVRIRSPAEFYALGRDWLLAQHPQIPAEAVPWIQPLLENICREVQTLVQLQSQLEMVSSLLLRAGSPAVSAGLSSLDPFLLFMCSALLAGWTFGQGFLVRCRSLRAYPYDPLEELLIPLVAAGLTFLPVEFWFIFIRPPPPLPPELVSLASVLAPCLPSG